MGLLQGVWSVVKGSVHTDQQHVCPGLVLKSPMLVSKNPTSSSRRFQRPRRLLSHRYHKQWQPRSQGLPGFLGRCEDPENGEPLWRKPGNQTRATEMGLEDSGQTVNLDPHAGPRKLELFHVYQNTPTSMHFPIKPPQTPVGTKTCVASDHYLLIVRLDYDSDRYITVRLIVRPS